MDRSECMACRDYQAAEQIFIFYGPRTNAEFFVHNGFVYPDNEHDGMRLRLFVYPDNEHDGMRLRLGISQDDLLQPKRAELLGRLGIPASGDFMLKKGPDPVDGRLLAFIRVLKMEQGKFKTFHILTNKMHKLKYNCILLVHFETCALHRTYLLA